MLPNPIAGHYLSTALLVQNPRMLRALQVGMFAGFNHVGIAPVGSLLLLPRHFLKRQAS